MLISLAIIAISAGGYEGGDETGERPKSGRAKEHFQEVSERLQERLPSRYRRSIRVGEAFRRTEEEQHRNTSNTLINQLYNIYNKYS